MCMIIIDTREIFLMDKIKKLFKIISCFFKDEDDLVFYLMELKALKCLDECFILKIGMTEELEDLIFHIRTYREIPNVIAEIKYPEFKNKKISVLMNNLDKKLMPAESAEKALSYISEVEKARAVERDFIFDGARVLTFGFNL